ncbi:uncharacterized protein ACIBXB_011589 isoform 1-T2 [Morphnus guianensis]
MPACRPFPAAQRSPEQAFSLFAFHVDEKGRSVLAIPPQLWFDALLKGDNISPLKGRWVISGDIMKRAIRRGCLKKEIPISLRDSFIPLELLQRASDVRSGTEPPRITASCQPWAPRGALGGQFAGAG